jgi:hypothetical protein
MAKNGAWTWKHGPQLPIYIEAIPLRTQQTKEGHKKHKNAADIHLKSYFKGKLNNVLIFVHV